MGKLKLYETKKIRDVKHLLILLLSETRVGMDRFAFLYKSKHKEFLGYRSFDDN